MVYAYGYTICEQSLDQIADLFVKRFDPEEHDCLRTTTELMSEYLGAGKSLTPHKVYEILTSDFRKTVCLKARRAKRKVTVLNPTLIEAALRYELGIDVLSVLKFK